MHAPSPRRECQEHADDLIKSPKVMSSYPGYVTDKFFSHHVGIGGNIFF